MNRLSHKIIIITTSLDGFSLANHWRFAKFAKLSPCQTFLHVKCGKVIKYIMNANGRNISLLILFRKYLRKQMGINWGKQLNFSSVWQLFTYNLGVGKYHIFRRWKEEPYIGMYFLSCKLYFNSLNIVENYKNTCATVKGCVSKAEKESVYQNNVRQVCIITGMSKLLVNIKFWQIMYRVAKFTKP